jgi:hypothetical protein
MGPTFLSSGRCVQYPDDTTSGIPDFAGEPIDVWDDSSGHGYFSKLAGRHEVVLHVDDQEGGPMGIEAIVGMALSAAELYRLNKARR